MNPIIFVSNLMVPLTSDKTNNSLYIYLIMISAILMIFCIVMFMSSKKTQKACYKGIRNKIKFIKFIMKNALLEFKK
ncbi:MAG: hypothetical protein RSC93_03780 [Erysipelotrichaceae bacterium]